MSEAELEDIKFLVTQALLEALYVGRAFCIFNHPLFPGQRFEINIGNTYEELAWLR